VIRGVLEVLVSGQQSETVSDAELRNQGVDCSDLNARPSAGIPQVGSCDVVFTIGLDQRQCREAIDDLGPCLRRNKAL
jgi:hypothetical protein